MIKLPPVALATVLLGYAHVEAQTGCYPAYSSSASYSKEDWASNTVQEEQSCSPPGENGCPDDGEQTVDVSYNFQCVGNSYSQFCGDGGYAPGSESGKLAWIQQSSACTGAAGSGTPPTPSPWTGPGGSSGCPAAHSFSESYEAGDVVSVPRSGYTAVYECSEADWQHCSTHDPLSHGGEQAWTLLGSCDGTISPTAAPNYASLEDQGGCPGPYDAGAEYEEDDRVSLNGLVYVCKAWPASEHCGQEGYEPDASSATEHWKDAWDVAGYCAGTVAPTSSPNFDVLEDAGGCPGAWEEGLAYEVGERVAKGGLVFGCTSATAGRCGQAGYAPDAAASAEDWKDAWEVVGHCSGTIAPTSSPTFDPANSIGGCPPLWESGGADAYEEGDVVSVVVSATPERKVAFVCKAYPRSGYCGQFSPLEFGGDQGWEVAGGCEGTISPTSSPSFDALAVDTNGCPAEYDPTKGDYEAGDRVALTASTTPERKIQFECKAWPHAGYCNMPSESYGPGGTHWELGWERIGACVGTMAPTASPIAYSGSCEYEQCREVDGTESCVEGSAGCTCTGTDPNKVCTKDVKVESCTIEPVALYSENFGYFPGDVIRLGTRRYKCKDAPLHLWCRVEAYKPDGKDAGIWKDAWTTDGT
ncbi:hypothetical protein ACHAWF_003276, partial [Thalassiosira exigua]